tara:strand:+ start:7927 stop:8496 length:570 start_codon:yes stop_codon:yes gene_type:complete
MPLFVRGFFISVSKPQKEKHLMTKEKKLRFQTPIAETSYTHLTTPDFEYNDDGVYSVMLVFDQRPQFFDEMEAYAAETFGKKKVSLPFKKNDEDRWVFKTKSKYRPKFFDSTGKGIPDEDVRNIWAGSVVRVGGTYKAFDNASKGVTTYPSRVQIISYAQSNTGFDAVDDGFVHEAVAQDTFDADEDQF